MIQARKAMQDNREYTSGKFPYGYKRSEEDKRKMAEKEAMEALQKYPDKFFELKSGDIPPELLASLIEKITVVSQGQIEITYAYSDIIEKWCEEAQLLDKKGAGEDERWICGNVS